MRKIMCLCLVLVMLSTLFIFPPIAVQGNAQDGDVLFTFESLESDAGSIMLGGTGSAFATYTDGILKVSEKGTNKNVLLSEGKIENVDQFTIHVEFSVPDGATNIENVVTLGESETECHRFEINAANNTSAVTAIYQRRSVNDYTEKITNTVTDVLSSAKWFSLDILIDALHSDAVVYLNGTKVLSVSQIDATALALEGFVGFRAAGTSFRNLKVASGFDSPIQEGNALFDFESLESTTGTIAIGGGGSSFASYSNGILTVSSTTSGSKNIILSDANIENEGQFTIHVEFAAPTVDGYFENVIILGTSETECHRFEVFATGNAGLATVNYQRRSVNTYSEKTSANTTISLPAGQWNSLDILVNAMEKTAILYLNKTKVLTVTDINTEVLGLENFLGFRAAGTAFRNLVVYKGLKNPAPLFTFESLETAKDTIAVKKFWNTTYSYADGILNLTGGSLFLADGDVSNQKQFTVHVEFKVAENSYVESCILLGEKSDSCHHRLDIYGNSMAGADNSAKVIYRLQKNESSREDGIAKTTTVDLTGNQWHALDLLVDGVNKTLKLYINETLVETLEGIDTSTIPLEGLVGFRGASYRNLMVKQGLVLPVSDGITAAQVLLNEKIDIIFTARIPEAKKNLHGVIYYKNLEIIPADFEISDDSNVGYQQVSFSLTEILPQDICETIAVRIYAGEQLMAECENYTIQKNCLNIMPTAEDAVNDSKKQELRNLLIALLNYGTASQKYFTNITTGFANETLLKEEIVSVQQNISQDITNGKLVSVKDATQTTSEDYAWKSATLAFYNTVRLRFRFTANSISNVCIKVNGVDSEFTEFESIGDNLYYWDYDQILANAFSDKVTVGLYVDGTCVQTVTYSVNSYVVSYSIADKNNNEALDELIQAVYDYGCMAQQYGGED